VPLGDHDGKREKSQKKRPKARQNKSSAKRRRARSAGARISPKGWCIFTRPLQHHRHHHRLPGQCDLLSSAGAMGFKGSRKGTPFAAQQARTARPRRRWITGCVRYRYCSGTRGGTRVGAARAPIAGINISLIKDVTPIPHNGCRPPSGGEYDGEGRGSKIENRG